MTSFVNPYRLNGNIVVKLRPSFGQASAKLRPVRTLEDAH